MRKIDIFLRTFIGTLMCFLKFYRKYQILTEWLSLHFISWEMQVSGSQLVQRYFGPTYLIAFIVNYTGLSKWCCKFASKHTWIKRSEYYIKISKVGKENFNITLNLYFIALHDARKAVWGSEKIKHRIRRQEFTKFLHILQTFWDLICDVREIFSTSKNCVD